MTVQTSALNLSTLSEKTRKRLTRLSQRIRREKGAPISSGKPIVNASVSVLSEHGVVNPVSVAAAVGIEADVDGGRGLALLNGSRGESGDACCSGEKGEDGREVHFGVEEWENFTNRLVELELDERIGLLDWVRRQGRGRDGVVFIFYVGVILSSWKASTRYTGPSEATEFELANLMRQKK